MEDLKKEMEINKTVFNFDFFIRRFKIANLPFYFRTFTTFTNFLNILS